MAVVLDWSSTYPGTKDTISTNFPRVDDGTHFVKDTHVNSLADAVVALETVVGGLRNANIADPLSPSDGEVLKYDQASGTFITGTGGGGGGPSDLTMGTNEFVSTLSSEQLVGGGVFDGSSVSGSSVTFRFIGNNNTSFNGSIELRLYDLGPKGGPLQAGDLRSTATILQAGGPFTTDVSLSIVSSLSNQDEILDSARIYEIRMFLNSSGGDGLTLWGGIVA
jgi:hypothetical protein